MTPNSNPPGFTDGEEWKLAPGFPAFEVSSLGRVRKLGGEPITLSPHHTGYVRCRLSKPRKMVNVHRLVALAFIPNPGNLPCVNHLDSDRANNRAVNLEWCTQEQNLAHARQKGRMVVTRGLRPPHAKFTDAQVTAIRARYAAGGISLERLGADTGASKRTIGRIVSGQYYPLPAPPPPSSSEDGR